MPAFIARLSVPQAAVSKSPTQPQGWLKLLYTSRCKMYEQGGSIEGTLAALEAEPAAGIQQQQQQQADAGADAGGAMQPAAAQQQQQQPGGGGSGSMKTSGKGAAAAAAAAAGGPQPMALSPLQGGPSSAVGGWGLSDNLDVIACRADWLYHRWVFYFAVCCVHTTGLSGACRAA